jgi:hypothetical protein
VAGAIIQGLQMLSQAIQTVFTVIATHQGAVEAFGTILGGIASVLVVQQLLGWASALAGPVVSALASAGTAILGFVAQLAFMQATEGTLAAMRLGFSALAGAVMSPVGSLILLGAAVGLLAKGYMDGRKDAEEFARAVEKKYGTDSVDGLQNSLTDLRSRYHELVDENERLHDGPATSVWNAIKTAVDQVAGPLYDTKDNLLQNAGAIDAIRVEIERLQNAANNRNTGLVEIQAAFAHTGQYAKDAQVDLFGFSEKLANVASIAEQAGIHVDTSSGALERIARSAKLDLSKDWWEWAPLLAEAAVRSELLGNHTGSLDAQMVTLAADTSSAADKLKAFKDVLDEVLGIPLSSFEAFTKIEQSLRDLNSALWEFVHNGGNINAAFDATSAEGLKLRDSLSGAADSAINYAKAIADEQGMPAAIQALSDYRQRIVDVLVWQGMSTDQANLMADSLGLTAQNIENIKLATGDGVPIPVKATNTEEATKEIDAVAEKNRLAIVTAQSANIPVVANELDTTASAWRPAPITAQSANIPVVEGELGFTARRRDSLLYQQPNTTDSEYWLGWGARWRNSPAYQAPNTSDAEWWLNYTARKRTAVIEAVVYTSSATVYAGPDGFGIAEGGIVNAYAQGGFANAYARGGFENHVAQIGSTGASRIWNEPETGGEAYIPLALSKRARSLAIWEETGRMLGASSSSNATLIQLHNSPNVTINGSGLSADDLQAAVTSGIQSGAHEFGQRLLVEIKAR